MDFVDLKPLDTGNIITAAGFAVAFVGLIFAGRQLRAAKEAAEAASRTSEGQFLLNLIPLLKAHDAIHRKLYHGEDWKAGTEPEPAEWLPVSEYMGVLEGIGVLARNDLLDLEVVDRLFGYRVGNLVRDDYIRNLVATSHGWVEFVAFWRALDDIRTKKNRSILCPGHPAPRA
jgi:hypothetical protein